MKIVGRNAEIKELERVKSSQSAEFVAVYGRRRMGKTFLVRECCQHDFDFYARGTANSVKKVQLENFYTAILKYSMTKTKRNNRSLRTGLRPSIS